MWTIDIPIVVSKEITEILGGMKIKLRKWASNSTEIVNTIPPINYKLTNILL